MAFLDFVKYNNAFPIAVSIALLGAGSTFAATNPDAIYSAQQQVLSIDNTYIANKDLAGYTPTIQIVGVTEDTDNYYVTYRLTTIDVVDSVWRDVTKEPVMQVDRRVLGKYGDLGLYVTEQLKQIIDRELAYLHDVQDIERKQVTNKVVATAYSGLVGALLDTTTETIPGYVPVVAPPPPPEIAVSSPADTSQAASQVAGASAAVPTSSGPGAPVLQILGNNPARIPVKTSYSDLGVVVTDDSGLEFTVRRYVEGALVQDISIDTSEPGEWHIRYEVTDNAGNTSSRERLLIVYDPNPPLVEATSTPPPESASSTPAASSSTASTTPAE